MIAYCCKCGFSGVADAYDLDEVICPHCGWPGETGKAEITKDSADLFLSDILNAWHAMKKEFVNLNGTLREACFGFKQGTPMLNIADWFVNAVAECADLDESDETDKYEIRKLRLDSMR